MCLLIAGLPVQSWAATTMINCGPSHQQRTIESIAAHDGMTHVQASRHDAMAPHSGHAHHQVDHRATAVAPLADANPAHPSDADLHSLQKLGKFKCSACASCCLGVALPSLVISFDASVSSDTPVAGMPQVVAVFLTDGLERPPRTIRA
jgi:hypothetical protein